MSEPESDEENLTTTAHVLRSLDVILFEIGHIDNVLGDGPRAHLNDAFLRDVRRRLSRLHRGADDLMSLLSEVRLELGTN